MPLDEGTEAANALAGLRILQVDDDPDAIETFGMLLDIPSVVSGHAPRIGCSGKAMSVDRRAPSL